MAPLRIKDHTIFDPLRGARSLVPFYRLYRGLSVALRRTTAERRAFPDFLVLGAAKAGTTSLFHYLSQHPRVFPGLVKEIHYFDYRFDRPAAWYRSHFPFRSRLGEGGVTGEASPSYLNHPLAPERIRQTCPNVKLIAILRNPVDRAVSQFFYLKKTRPHFRMSLAECLAREDADHLEALNQGRLRGEVYPAALKHRGLYADQLRRYLRHFPRENLHVVIFERMCREPNRELQEVFSFLGVPDSFVPGDLKARNIGGTRRDVPPDVIGGLRRFFAPYNADLADLLGEELPW